MHVETDRLILRPLGVADLDDFFALASEPEVSRFIGTATREEAAERLRECEREWRERGHDLIAVLERETGRFLGRTALKYWSQFGETEVGWAFHARTWGHGYATEAGRASIAWGFENLELDYITCMIRPENERSLAVARRLELRRLRDDVLLGVDVIVHGVSREEWDHRSA